MSTHVIRRRNVSHPRFARRACCTVERVESRIHLAIDVAVGTGAAARTVVFTDGDGTQGAIRVNGGAATLTFEGSPDVSQSTSGGVSTVTGTNVQWLNMVITGTNPSVVVTTTGGNGQVILGGMSAAGPVSSVQGRGVVLGGTTTLSNGIGRVELAGINDADITINRSGQARLQDASITALAVQESTITSQQPLRMLRVGSWTSTIPGQPDSVTTPRINLLQSGGDFMADLALSGNGQAVGRPILGNVRVLGALREGEWNVTGRASRVAADSIASNWAGTFGDVASISVAGDVAGNITANSVNSLSAETFNGARINLTRPFQGRSSAVNRLSARGAITNTIVRSNADIGTVSAASITTSTFFAGVQGDVLPTAATAFVNAATIRNVTIRNRGATTPVFVASNIAASTLGRMNLGTVQVTNNGIPFGLAAQTIQSLSAIGANNTPVREARMTEPTDSLDLGDFEVRVF